MNQIIVPATFADLDIILGLFEEAIRYQRDNDYIGWKSMDVDFLKADIRHGLLYKVLSEGRILGVFSVCFVDKLIWRDKEKGDAIYLHRIVLNRAYAGAKIFGLVLHWATSYARKNRLRYVRMDTWAENAKLIGYYQRYGFRVIENYTTEDTNELPIQHRNLKVALLELEIK
ncbi:MAG: GNAT family N-acetyltransferase [Bacteroidota bacterium]